jgi:hypothetical protein
VAAAGARTCGGDFAGIGGWWCVEGFEGPVAGIDADQRHQPAELGEIHEGEAVEPADAGLVGVARSPATALGEEHHRQLQLFGDLEQAVLLVLVEPPICLTQGAVVP